MHTEALSNSRAPGRRHDVPAVWLLRWRRLAHRHARQAHPVLGSVRVARYGPYPPPSPYVHYGG
eukprot:325541-Chlamydomonas_euryale.AAC.1